jgi:hypothetical protein
MALDAGFLEEDLVQGLWGEPRGRETFALMIHELGHVVGLDHVDADSEIMYLEMNGVYEFQQGDKEGLAIAGQGACGVDLLGNLTFGKDVSPLGSNVPSSCVIESLEGTHEMFERRQEGSIDDRPCLYIPFSQGDTVSSLSVNYKWVDKDSQAYFDEKLSQHSADDSPEQLAEKRKFGEETCDVLAVSSKQGASTPLYWLHIFCSGKVTEVVGESLDTNRYFESPTLQAIVKHRNSTVR